MNRRLTVAIVGLPAGVVESLALVTAVSKGFLVPIAGNFSVGAPGSSVSNQVQAQAQAGATPLVNPLSFSVGFPGLLVVLVMFTVSFLSGYVLADLGEAVRALAISQITCLSFVASLLLVLPSRVSALPENLQAFFFFAFIAYFLFNFLGFIVGGLIGDW